MNKQTTENAIIAYSEYINNYLKGEEELDVSYIQSEKPTGAIEINIFLNNLENISDSRKHTLNNVLVAWDYAYNIMDRLKNPLECEDIINIYDKLTDIFIELLEEK